MYEFGTTELREVFGFLSVGFFAGAAIFLAAAIILCLLYARKNNSASYALLVLAGMTKEKSGPEYIGSFWFASWLCFQLFGLFGISWFVVELGGW